MVQDRIVEKTEQLKGRKLEEDSTPEIKDDDNEKGKLQQFSGETYALKVINKSVLRLQEINVIRGESKILKNLVGLPNVVQFLNIFETDKFIIIQMEHLTGNQMKRELKAKLAEAQENMQFNDDETDSDLENYHKNSEKKGKNAQDSPDKRPAEQGSIFNKFDEPYKFWKHQLSFKENEITDLEQSLYTEEVAS